MYLVIKSICKCKKRTKCSNLNKDLTWTLQIFILDLFSDLNFKCESMNLCGKKIQTPHSLFLLLLMSKKVMKYDS